MNVDLRNADSRVLHEPFAESLQTNGAHATYAWLIRVLSIQSPSLRSSNSYLVAYTGCREAVDWLEASVDSPVTTHWGQGAALLGTPWPRVKAWLTSGGARQLMALDTLIAYRAPAPNMAPLAQIAAPTLPEAPTLGEFETTLAGVLSTPSTPRIRKAVDNVIAYAAEILSRKHRGVAVSDLPLLYLHPELFSGASEILDKHEAVISSMLQSLRDLVNRGSS